MTSIPSQKPILTVTDADLPYCGRNCLATGGVAKSIPAMVKTNFPGVDDSNFTAVIQPNTGHGINSHYNATVQCYQQVLELERIDEFLSGRGT